MKETIDLIKRHALNGINSYALFGFYSLTLAPFLADFIAFGDTSSFIALCGFVILILESFAFVFKLKMIRIRSEIRRIDHKNLTGEDITPHPHATIIWGFFMRLVLRFVVLGASIQALGIVCEGKEVSPLCIWPLLMGVFIDVCVIGYIYVHGGFFRDHYLNPREEKQDDDERETWNAVHLPRYLSAGYYWKELGTDIVLQVYAFMAFTAFWYFVNMYGLESIENTGYDGFSESKAYYHVFPQLIAMVLMGLMPIRIAYWLEDSTMAFHWKEKLGMWIVFALTAVFTLSPTIIEYLSVFVLHEGSIKEQILSPYFNLFLSFVLLVLVMLVHLLLSRPWMHAKNWGRLNQ